MLDTVATPRCYTGVRVGRKLRYRFVKNFGEVVMSFVRDQRRQANFVFRPEFSYRVNRSGVVDALSVLPTVLSRCLDWMQ